MPIDVQPAEPRYFGLGTPIFSVGVAAALLVLGILLIATGYPVVGILAVVVAVCLLPAFLAGARRWPDSRLAQLGVSTADRVRDEAGVAVESISTWSRTGRDVARLRKQQFRLRRERDAKVRQLGPSFYSDDGRANEIKAEAKELDERIAANERKLQRTIAAARRRTRQERATVVATEVIAPEPDPDVTMASPAEDEPLTRAEGQAGAEPKPAAAKRHARSR